MENWSSVIYKYQQGVISKELALKIVKARIQKALPRSRAKRELIKFRDKLTKEGL